MMPKTVGMLLELLQMCGENQARELERIEQHFLQHNLLAELFKTTHHTSDAQSISKVVDCVDNFYRLTVLKHKMNTEKLSDKQKQENFPFIPKRAA